ncbi:MAG: hypothetical protein LBN23_04860 [Paludibacter sp.]|jgi:hypothetical protein|nr:hypothetical protein [Paludibacter sp.]
MQHELTEIPQKLQSVLIPILNSKSSFDIFSEERSYLQTRCLPFFKNYGLLSATSYSSIPPVTIEYLWNKANNDIIKLDGTNEPIFNNLDKLGLILNDETLVPYTKFVLNCIQTEHGSLRLTETLSKDAINHVFTDTPTDEQVEFLQKTVRPATFVKNGNKCLIDAIVLYGDTVYQADIEVTENGIIEILSETELRAGLPIRPIFLE